MRKKYMDLVSTYIRLMYLGTILCFLNRSITKIDPGGRERAEWTAPRNFLQWNYGSHLRIKLCFPYYVCIGSHLFAMLAHKKWGG